MKSVLFSFRSLITVAGLTGLLLGNAQAYPDYQAFIVKNSKKPVNCAMCHAHSDGPDGTAPGQIGGLNAEELGRLGQARAALEPGKTVNSPILNPFGNHLIKTIGKKKFLELKISPANLVDVMDKTSDLDDDGIPDYQEYLEGTHPLNKSDGNPWILFKTNFQRNLGSIVLTLIATASGLYGLVHLLHGFAIAARRED